MRHCERATLAATLLVILSGCASTQVETTGATLREPFCNEGAGKLSALVYWGPQWRSDQKEPERREAAALRGIEGFFADAGCVAGFEVRRLPGGRMAELPPDEALQKLDQAAPRPDKVLVIVVRELRPDIGSAFLDRRRRNRSGAELRLPDAGSAQANVRTHQKRRHPRRASGRSSAT
jgi:hypothetical protein